MKSFQGQAAISANVPLLRRRPKIVLLVTKNLFAVGSTGCNEKKQLRMAALDSLMHGDEAAMTKLVAKVSSYVHRKRWREAACVVKAANRLDRLAGGVLIGLVIQLCDSVAKNIALTLAVVLTASADALCFSGPLNLPICAAAGTVLISVVNYNAS